MNHKLMASLIEKMDEWLSEVVESGHDLTTTTNVAEHMATAAAAVLDAMNEAFAEHAEHEGV